MRLIIALVVLFVFSVVLSVGVYYIYFVVEPMHSVSSVIKTTVSGHVDNLEYTWIEFNGSSIYKLHIPYYRFPADNDGEIEYVNTTTYYIEQLTYPVLLYPELGEWYNITCRFRHYEAGSYQYIIVNFSFSIQRLPSEIPPEYTHGKPIYNILGGYIFYYKVYYAGEIIDIGFNTTLFTGKYIYLNYTGNGYTLNDGDRKILYPDNITEIYNIYGLKASIMIIQDTIIYRPVNVLVQAGTRVYIYNLNTSQAGILYNDGSDGRQVKYPEDVFAISGGTIKWSVASDETLESVASRWLGLVVLAFPVFILAAIVIYLIYNPNR